MAGAVVLLFGPPAAGKSSLARELLTRYRALGPEPPLLYLGTDALRETISGRNYVASARSVVYAGVVGLLEAALGTDHNVLVDGNYLEPEYREQITTAVARSGSRLLKVLVTCRLEVGLRRNSSRMPDERVPDDYLEKVYARVPEAREDSDIALDSERSLAGCETEILTWLLGAAPTDNAPSEASPWERYGTRRTLSAGEVLWRTGEASAQVISLTSGELEVVREQPGQPAVVLNRLQAGTVAGDLSSLDGSPHSATLRASLESEVSILPASHFRVLLRREPELLDTVLEGMAGRIRSLSGRAGTASVDLLTGLGNRRMMEDVWPGLAEAARRDGEPLAVALFDVDRFKGINDTYGHHLGDLVLQEISRRLLAAIPHPGICLRFGGDEFVVLLPDCDQERAMELMTKFAQSVRGEPMATDHGVALTATVSVGVASFPQPVDSVEELFERADQAAYVSKGQGRDRVTGYGAV